MMILVKDLTSFGPQNETLTSTTDQCGSENYSKERVLHTPQTLILEAYNQMQFFCQNKGAK